MKAVPPPPYMKHAISTIPLIMFAYLHGQASKNSKKKEMKNPVSWCQIFKFGRNLNFWTKHAMLNLIFAISCNHI